MNGELTNCIYLTFKMLVVTEIYITTIFSTVGNKYTHTHIYNIHI